MVISKPLYEKKTFMKWKKPSSISMGWIIEIKIENYSIGKLRIFNIFNALSCPSSNSLPIKWSQLKIDLNSQYHNNYFLAFLHLFSKWFDNKISTNRDKITDELIENGWPVITEKLYNIILRYRKIPEEWKTTVIVPHRWNYSPRSSRTK